MRIQIVEVVQKNVAVYAVSRQHETETACTRIQQTGALRCGIPVSAQPSFQTGKKMHESPNSKEYFLCYNILIYFPMIRRRDAINNITGENMM